jgi:cobalt-precorrin 5A hydrolase
MAHRQAVSERLVAIGIGCRAGASATNIVALVQRTLSDAQLDGASTRLFSIDTKQDEIGLVKAARVLAMPITFLPRDMLAARSADACTRSGRIAALYDLPSVAETAALAGAGEGSRLIVPRVSAGAATCAIAIGER